jgi:hypothetical protein
MIENGIVTNIISTDNKEQTEMDLHCTLVEMTKDIVFGIGWFWDGAQFVNPNPDEILNQEV